MSTRANLAVAAVLAASAVAAAPSEARADDSADLLDRADMVYRGSTSAAVFEMKIKTASYERSYEVVVWDQSGKDERTLIKLLGPALWRGFGTLKVGDRLKLYDPKTNHVTSVGHSMLGDSWMGSHFSNDDLVRETRLATDYEIKPLRSWDGSNERGDAGTFHELELTPKPSAPVAWGKIVYQLWSGGDAAVPVSVDYYRDAGDTKPARTIRFSELRELGGRLVPATMQVTVAKKPKEYTRLTYKKLKFGVKIPASKFTEQALRK